MIQSGRVLRLFPEQGENGTQWYAPTDPVRALPKGDSVFIKGIFPLMYEAVRNGDSDGLRGLIDKTAAFQRERGAAGVPAGRTAEGRAAVQPARRGPVALPDRPLLRPAGIRIFRMESRLGQAEIAGSSVCRSCPWRERPSC